MGDGWSLDIFRKLLPDPYLVPLRAGVVVLLLRLVKYCLAIALVVLDRMRSFVEAAGPRSAQQLLGVRRQQGRVLGHAVEELNGPDVVLLLLLLLDRGRDIDPFVAPLSDGEACGCLRQSAAVAW